MIISKKKLKCLIDNLENVLSVHDEDEEDSYVNLSEYYNQGVYILAKELRQALKLE